MSATEPIEVIVRAGVLPIARGLSRDILLGAAGALRSAGIDVIEITLDSPDAFGTIRALRAHDGHLTVGAGTVRSDELARQAVEAGAQFLVTPGLDERVTVVGAQLKVPVILGALTPTEISVALDLGAELVKVFPAATLGPGYIQQVLAPLHDARLVPTGGITPSNAGEYIAGGAVAVGVGGALLGARASDTQWLAAQAHALIAAVQQGRRGGVARHA